MRSLPGPTFPLTTEGKEESGLQTSALLLPRLREPLFPPQVSLGLYLGLEPPRELAAAFCTC